MIVFSPVDRTFFRNAGSS